MANGADDTTGEKSPPHWLLRTRLKRHLMHPLFFFLWQQNKIFTRGKRNINIYWPFSLLSPIVGTNWTVDRICPAVVDLMKVFFFLSLSENDNSSQPESRIFFFWLLWVRTLFIRDTLFRPLLPLSPLQHLTPPPPPHLPHPHPYRHTITPSCPENK